MLIKITINEESKTYNAIKKESKYTYKDEGFIIEIDTLNNKIIRKNKGYNLTLEFFLNKISKNICNYNGNKFIIEVETFKINNENFYELSYKVADGEVINFKLEEIND